MKTLVFGSLICLCSGIFLFAVSPVFAQNDGTEYNQGGNENGTSPDKGVPCDPEKDIMLNTNIPFIGRCIKKSTNAGEPTSNLGNAFPRLMGGLIRVVMGAVVIVALLAVLVGGFMVAAEGAAGTKQKGLELIKLAIGGLVLIGLSGIILNLINPNFFRTASLLLPRRVYL